MGIAKATAAGVYKGRPPSMEADQLRDLLHAEKQLLKALPKMAQSARFTQLKGLFELHLKQTEHQVERIEECFKELDVAARAKPCNGMMGIIEEGE